MPDNKKGSKKTTSTVPPARAVKPQAATAELGPNEINIRFHHPHQVLPKLLELAQHFSQDHINQLASLAPAAQDILGEARASIIVSNCAHSTAWLATLADLGLNPLIFRNCVSAGVSNAGYRPPSNIPASPDTRLIDVIAAIQGAPHK